MFIEINQNLKNIKVRLIFIFLKDVSTLLICEVTKMHLFAEFLARS